MAKELNVDVSDVVEGGTALAFVAYPTAITKVGCSTCPTGITYISCLTYLTDITKVRCLTYPTAHIKVS